jgi:hypothetical protein
MSQPNVRGLVVSGPLQRVSIAYRNNAYIADRLFPVLDAPSPESKLARYLKGAWFRDEAAQRAPGTRARRGGYNIDYIDIITKEIAYGKEVTSEDRQYAKLPNSAPMRPDIDAIEFCRDKILLRRERLAAAMVKDSTWSAVSGEDVEGGWAAGSGNTFISDIEDRIITIEQASGFRPNILMLSSNTLKELKQEDTVLDRIKYTQKGIVTSDMLASLFDLEEVLVGGAIYSDAEEVQAGSDFNAVSIWEKTATKGMAFLCYRPRMPGLKIPSAGYIARTPYENGQYQETRTYYEAAEDQDVYECREKLHIVQTGTDVGFYFYDTIAN